MHSRHGASSCVAGGQGPYIGEATRVDLERAAAFAYQWHRASG